MIIYSKFGEVYIKIVEVKRFFMKMPFVCGLLLKEKKKYTKSTFEPLIPPVGGGRIRG